MYYTVLWVTWLALNLEKTRWQSENMQVTVKVGANRTNISNKAVLCYDYIITEAYFIYHIDVILKNRFLKFCG